MPREKTSASFCEMPQPKKKAAGNRSNINKDAFYKHKGDFSWTGVLDQEYKSAGSTPGGGGWANIVRRVLVGGRGESTRFHVRYFEIGPGGRSSLEHHRHEHVVICVRGEGMVKAGRSKKKLAFMDTLYIAPGTVHQLLNPFEEPFGFLCIVNSRRDRPKVIKT